MALNPGGPPAGPGTTAMEFHFNDRISPSDRQLQDVAGVYTVQGDALDLKYLHHWAPILGVEQEVAALLLGKLKPKSTLVLRQQRTSSQEVGEKEIRK